jgi:acetyltransferase
MRPYPDDTEEVVELGAERFMLRAIGPEDEPAHADFISRLDASDLRRRFFDAEGISREGGVERARINHDREVAFVAIRGTPQGGEEIVGEARAHLYPGASTAELAIAVRGDMRGRGLGRVLMRKTIEYCAAHGLEIIAQILPENEAMIRLAKRCGMQVELSPGRDLAIAHMVPAA